MQDMVLVAGSRSLTNEELVWDLLDGAGLEGYETLIQGGARGIDTLAGNWGRARGMAVTQIDAEWAKYGKSAGYKRNLVMLDMVHRVIVIWDGKSPGSRHTIEQAKKLGKRLTVFTVSATEGN